MKILNTKVFSNTQRNNARNHIYYVLATDDSLVLRICEFTDVDKSELGTEYTKDQLLDTSVDTGDSLQKSWLLIDEETYLVTTNIIKPNISGNLAGDGTILVWDASWHNFNVFDFNKMYPFYVGVSPLSILRRQRAELVFSIFRKSGSDSLLNADWIVYDSSNGYKVITNLEFDETTERSNDSVNLESQFLIQSSITDVQLNTDNSVSFRIKLFTKKEENLNINTRIVITPMNGDFKNHLVYDVSNGKSDVITVNQIENSHIMFQTSILFGSIIGMHEINVV